MFFAVYLYVYPFAGKVGIGNGVVWEGGGARYLFVPDKVKHQEYFGKKVT